MPPMPRPRPPYLHRFKNRHGTMLWYVRKPRGRRVRIRAEYGTDEFDAEYKAAIDGLPVIKLVTRTTSGSVAWLWERYRDSAPWRELGGATHRQRENIMVHVLASMGDKPYLSIRQQDIVASRDARSETPAQARNFLDCMRGMFRWALDAQHVKTDPTAGVKNPKRRKTGGFPPWNENNVEAYQARWPIGTKERVWLDMLLYTGPRRGDVCRLGRQHTCMVFDPEIQETIEVISFKTEKGGELIDVTIPILPVLRTTLDAGPCGDLTFIVGCNGRPYTKESFGNAFSAAARAAGVKKSAHGVRKIAATTAADNGATVHQLMSIFGWITEQMALVYTKEADRKRLARGAMHMLGRTVIEHPMCPPQRRVGTSTVKSE